MECELSKITFYNLCNCLENIVQVDSKEQKCETLVNLFNNVFKTQDVNQIFNILRLILPEFDKSRTTYGMKEAAIGKYVAHTFNIDKHSDDYKMLYINDYPEMKRSKDYALVVSKILYRYHNTPPSELNIFKINEYLTNISKKSDFYKNLLNILSPVENKWIIRIILKNIRLGLTPESILTLFHPRAVSLFEHNNDLYSIIKNCIQPERIIEGNGLDLFQFIRPMLSIKASKKLLSEIALINYFVEEKFDGERFQLHYDRNKKECKWFSRNGHVYPFEALTNEIPSILISTVENVILDGEMVGFNLNTKKYGTKGFNYDIKKVKDTSSYQASFIIFDIIYLNHRNLSEAPLQERRKLLETNLLKYENDFIKISIVNHLENYNDILKYLTKAISNDLEGIVIKDPTSFYLSNKRTSNWIKIKPDYFEGLITDLDLLIIGGYYGDGRQSGQIATFLLAVFDETQNNYVSIGQSGLGLTKNDLIKLQIKLGPHWQKVGKNDKMPKMVKWGKEKPHVWIEPKHSIILEIKASELHRSDNFITKYTLRFPRIVRVRYDKPFDQCLKLSEYRELVSNKHDKPVVKLARLPTINDLLITSDNDTIQNIKTEPIVPLNRILNDRKFSVLSGTENLTETDIKKLIIENGGIVINNYKNHEDCLLIGDKRNFLIQTEINLNKRDIVKVSWLLKIIANQKYIDWNPEDALLVCTLERKKEFNLNFDSYCDHYTRHADYNSLENCLNNMSNTMDIC
ncbi:DNA ligase 4 [Chrysoperla carnea]|uniref:DNA ligase 4 n=1 Tax=Chrysoperla carnea TaxID=189513 RepID=UPI001D0672DB|nr:DNA ligase 4 [Chrysoperla carnea]